MLNPVKTFEPNENGRDFVIGDLHGSYSCFERLLEGIEFDRTKDRMFSVGDLVDRGPNSLDCLRLLHWVHAVYANHEQMMYEAFNGGYVGQYWFQNGGNWGMEHWNMFETVKKKAIGSYDKDHPCILSTDDMDLFDLLEKVEELPFLITINHKNGKKFHIMHAEFPPGYEISDAILSSPGKVQELATTISPNDGGESFLWGRYRFRQFSDRDMSNDKVRESLVRTAKYHKMHAQFGPQLSHIISGHTILHHPTTLYGQTNIDTGARNCYPRARKPRQKYDESVSKWAALTCINLDDWTFWQATPTEFRSVEPFVINSF